MKSATVHRPSYAPLLMAAGLLFLLWGAVVSWTLSAGGLALIGYAAFRWIQDAHEPAQAAVTETVAQQKVVQHTKVEAARAVDDRRASFGLHCAALVLAASALASLVSGALVTSEGSTTSTIETVHWVLAAVVGAMSLAVAIWLYRSEGRRWLRNLGWIAFAAVPVQALLGLWDAAAVHALLAQLFFSVTVALALGTSRLWTRPPATAAEQSRFSLRVLSLAALATLILQVALGAAVRHKMMSAVPHIASALVVTIVVLLTAILAQNQFPEHPVLRPASKAVVGITFTQVMLGMATFITRLMMNASSLVVVVPSVAHVATGSLTLAATLVLTLEIQRDVRPRAQ
jgi:heme A synthase